jgi:hypothetical protein
MEFLVNELSLHGQFHSVETFIASLKELMRCRDVAAGFQYPLYCSRRIVNRTVTSEMFFKQAVAHQGELTRRVMIWIDRQGPFWDEPPEHDAGEWYEWQKDIVTETSLGEACYKLSRNTSTAVISFSPSDFLYNPLHIIWRQSDTWEDTVELENFWQAQELHKCLESYRPLPSSWTSLVEQARADFSQLILLDSVLDALAGEPFNITIARRVLELLGILNTLKNSMDDKGAFTAKGHELLQNHFRGKKAAFSDESETNKQLFKQALTFRKPDGEQIFCPYHGKIGHRYFRIHHSWPIHQDEPLYIAYIGPKITKK